MVFSAINMSVMGATAISISIVGILLEYISSDILFLFIGVCASLCIFLGLKNKNFLYIKNKFN